MRLCPPGKIVTHLLRCIRLDMLLDGIRGKHGAQIVRDHSRYRMSDRRALPINHLSDLRVNLLVHCELYTVL